MKLDNVFQESYVQGMQMSLAQMNEEDYCLKDTLTGEQIPYGVPFFTFRGRVFINEDNWEKWLSQSARKQRRYHALTVREDYHRFWDKYKKTRKNP